MLIHFQLPLIWFVECILKQIDSIPEGSPKSDTSKIPTKKRWNIKNDTINYNQLGKQLRINFLNRRVPLTHQWSSLEILRDSTDPIWEMLRTAPVIWPENSSQKIRETGPSHPDLRRGRFQNESTKRTPTKSYRNWTFSEHLTISASPWRSPFRYGHRTIPQSGTSGYCSSRHCIQQREAVLKDSNSAGNDR
jgi:hypothetical protein